MGFTNQEGKNSGLKRFCGLIVFLLFFPLLPLLLSTVFGGVMAAVENSSFKDAFLYVASNLLNMSTPLTEFNPRDEWGVLIDVYVSVVALMTFGICINVVNLFQIPLAINGFISIFVSGKVLVPFIALAFVIPSIFGVVGAIFGSLLAYLEGWALTEGIYYCFGNLLGLGTPLTDVLPQSMKGDLIDIIVSSMALGCVSVVVDYVTVLNPARYMRKRAKEVLARAGVYQKDDAQGSTILSSARPIVVNREKANANESATQRGHERENQADIVDDDIFTSSDEEWWC